MQHADDKRSPASTPTDPQATAMEAESARLLANKVRPELHEAGLNDDDIGRLAAEYIAQGHTGQPDPGAFLDWAKEQTAG